MCKAFADELKNKYLKLIKSEPNQEYEEGWKLVNSYLNKDHTKDLLKHLGSFICVFNYRTFCFEFFSDNLLPTLGYKPETLTALEGWETFEKCFSENQLPYLLEIQQKVFQYISINTQKNQSYSRLKFNIKLRNINSESKWYLIDICVLQSDENGFPLRSIITCTKDFFKNDEVINYNLLKRENDTYISVLNGSIDHFYGHLHIGETEEILTKREFEIFKLIAKGCTNSEIAEQLFVSLNTVQTHRKRILKKTGCTGIAELTRLALSRGVI